MASLKNIRRRIASVKSTQKVTRAMKLVAGAKLRRAQDNVIHIRPYALRLREVIAELSVHTAPNEHPLLQRRDGRRVLLLLFTSDRGLCGAFNTNAIRASENYRRQRQAQGDEVHLAVIGRKGTSFFRYHQVVFRGQFAGVDVKTADEDTKEISRYICDEYLGKQLGETRGAPSVDEVVLIYNEFHSAMSQVVKVEPLLPIDPNKQDTDPDQAETLPGGGGFDMIYEPNKRAVLSRVLPMYVEYELFRAASESLASEHGARMTAMENATKNANELIDDLTLEYNKTRQAAITKELLEIVSGAEALKG